MGRESTLLSEHGTAAKAFAEIDRLASEIVRTGARGDYVELFVVDGAGRLMRRPDAQ